MALKQGWHVPNSVNIDNIFPEWRTVGGGITSEDLHLTRRSALAEAIKLTDNRRIKCHEHFDLLLSEMKECADE